MSSEGGGSDSDEVNLRVSHLILTTGIRPLAMEGSNTAQKIKLTGRIVEDKR